MGNLGGSVVSMLKSCDTVGVETNYMGNVWAGDYKTLDASQSSGFVFPSSTPFYGQDVPGMAKVQAIFEAANPGSETKPTHHYIRGICSAYYMKEAMDWAKANGGITGANIKKAMYQKSDWVPAGLEGVCSPSSWSDKDHRGLMTVNINRGAIVDGKAQIDFVTATTLERRADWLGL